MFAPVAGIAGTVRAAEAMKLVAGVPSGLRRRLMLIDALSVPAQVSTICSTP